jgi:amino acid transporter
MDIEDRSGASGGATSTAVVGDGASSLDVSQRTDIGQLKKAAVGLGGVLFISFAAMSPLTGQLGNVPLAIGLGNGIGAPAGFEIGIVMLALFCVGYLQMLKRVPSSGGFYSFISRGLGRPLGMAAGWSSVMAYAVIVGSLLGAFSYFGNITIKQFFHVSIPWPVLAFAALALIGILGHFDVRLNTRILGVALILEMLVLTVMIVAVFAKGGGPSGVTVSPINPVNAFKGLAPGVGIFYAVWSWVGFETIPNYAEESKNPRRIGGQALFICVIGGGLFFMVASWAVIVGWGLHSAVHEATVNGGNYYYDVSTKFVGTWLTDVMEWLIMTSSFACALSFHNTTSRYLYVIGREGVFNKKLGRTHPRWESPYVANAVTVVIVALLTGAFIASWYAFPSWQAFVKPFGGWAVAPYYELFGWYAIIATFTVLVNQLICSIACITFFRQPENQDGWNIWTTGVFPVLSVGAMGYVLYLLWHNLSAIGGGGVDFVQAIPWICIAWMALGLILALVMKARSPQKYEVLGRMVNTGIE